MTILETFIKLRDDLKTWVTNNLNQKANISYVDEKFDSISEFDPTEIQEAIDANTAAIDTKVDKVEGKGLSTNDYTTAEKDKLSTVEANANFYEHPVHTSHSSGLYKVIVDESGHVSGATLAEKEDIVALGIPAQDTTYEEEIEDLSGRLDDVENDIGVIINETLNDLAQDFESYKTTNNEAVSTNASGIEANKTAIEEIQGDYLTSTDKTQLEDDISKVSEKATANASAIEILNGEGTGSVKQSIDNAFNEFAANMTNDDVVNTYKELIDYAAKHGPEFTELVGKVDTINTHVGEVEVDLSNYKTAVSDQFTEVDTTINNHVTDTNNPHSVTKEQVGLANVDNTPDIEKPISNATQAALDEKANLEHAHSDLYYDKDEIEELVTIDDIDDICGSNEIIGGGNATVVSYATKQWVQNGYQPKGNYLTSVPDGYATESYVDTKIATIPTHDVSGQINTHNLATDAHNDIRLLVDGLTTRLNTLADCDDTTLDQMSEVVEYIKSNQSLIEGVTTKKVNVSDIINNLTTNVSNKPLSAAQGVVLKSLIDTLSNNLTNYQPKGEYLTELPVGGEILGGVKNGGNVVINADGTMTAPEAGVDIDLTDYIELLPESSYPVSEDMGMVYLNMGLTFIAGKTYLIKWNGVPYICVAYEHKYGCMILEGDGYPFWVEAYDNSTEVYASDGSTSVTLAIYEKIAYATEEWVEKKLEEHSGGNVSWNDLTDKPFGEETTVLYENPEFWIDAEGYGSAEVGSNFLETGETYEVDFNGNHYACVCTEQRYGDQIVRSIDGDDVSISQQEGIDQINVSVDAEVIYNVFVPLKISKVNVERLDSKYLDMDAIRNEVGGAGSGGNVDLEGYATEQWVEKNYQPKGDYALRSEIPSVPVKSVNGKTGAVILTASDVCARPNTWMPSAADVGALPDTTAIPIVPDNISAFANDAGYLTAVPSEYITETELTAKGYLTEHQDLSAYAKTADLGDLATKDSLTASEVGADASGTASAVVSTHNTSTTAHADIRAEISNLSFEVANIPSEVYIGSGTPINGEKIQINPNGEGNTFTIPDVLQTTGTSTVDTMSQKAITDALNSIQGSGVTDEQIASAIEDYLVENPITGSNGRGIVSTARTSGTGAAGTTDTYTITYTDNTTSTFTVYNGENGANGKSAYQYAQSGGYTGTEVAFTTALANAANQTTETWTFTLEDGSTVSKTVVLL